MVNRIRSFFFRHYLVAAYCFVGLCFALIVLFKNDLGELAKLVCCVLALILFAVAGALAYIIIRAVVADKVFELRVFRTLLLVSFSLVAFFFFLEYVLQIPHRDLLKMYILAPLASWPAILSVLILNIFTKWNKRKDKGCRSDINPNLPKAERRRLKSNE